MARALERGELPRAGFHHADHLRVAWVFLEESPNVDAALGRMAAALRRFAASVGKTGRRTFVITPTARGRAVAARVSRHLAALEHAVSRRVTRGDVRAFLKVIEVVGAEAHARTHHGKRTPG